MRINSNLSLFESKTHPMLCKDYLNIPTRVFRNGKWVDIQEYNRSVNSRKR
jgi:hypothetical protein